MGKFIEALFRALWPIREHFETDTFYNWRAMSAALGLGLFMGLAMNVALAFGFITLFGFSGFAQAGEVSELKLALQSQTKTFNDRSNDIMAVVIGGQIFEVRG